MKALGLDLGTNSIGWAVIEKFSDSTELLAKGVHVFPKGVGDSKSGEYSLAAERTGFRSARRLKFRRKLRKLAVLEILSKYDYCPSLSADELNDWRREKIYPVNKNFREWLLTDDGANKNPYYYRNLAAQIKLDINDQKSRYMLGRAFYHLAQRRGYKSNALEISDEATGKVTKAIETLQADKGELTLGQFFYKEYYGLHGKLDKDGTLARIRSTYTSREEDYLTEFQKICEKQELPEKLVKALHRELFFQRPLKSQKGNIAKCPFETKKQRIAVSHPLFERFRMFQFINNIKIRTPADKEMRALNVDERNEVEKTFYVKDNFKFEKIAKKLCPSKAKMAYYRNNEKDYDYLFNYRLDTTVAPCSTISQFMKLFDDAKGDYVKLLEQVKNNYLHSKNKTSEECLIDIWHVLFSFEDSSKRIEFGREKLNLNEEKANKFNAIKLKQDYGQLSLKAIRKFLPFLKNGIKYSTAAFFANLTEIMKEYGAYDQNELYAQLTVIIEKNAFNNRLIDTVNALIKTSRDSLKSWNYDANTIAEYKTLAKESLKRICGLKKWERTDSSKKDESVNIVIDIFEEQQAKNQTRGEFLKKKTIKEEIGNFLKKNYGVGNEDIEKIYHPSAIEIYQKANHNEDGGIFLGDPRISSIKNPVFMRTMFRLRALVNELLKQNIIDQDTRINIEMARDLNDANRRKAIANYQRGREKLRTGYSKKIEEFYEEKNINRVITDTEILKYQLWDEQQHYCPYTGESIGVEDFLGANPKYDIEHTFPRSRSCDNSQVNMTLTERRYNRQIKRNFIPAELPDYDKILQHVKSFGWQKKVDSLQKQIEKIYPAAATTKEEKDKRIVRRHELSLERNYYKDKVFRFTADEIPNNFVSRQLVDTRIICKYAKMYLQTVFEKVYSYKALALKPFYKVWGLDEKSRETQLHHCVDAIIAACLTRDDYDKVAKFYNELDEHELYDKPKPETIPPWSNFAYDINVKLSQEVIVNSVRNSNLLKKAKKKVRKHGKIERTDKGNIKYATGDSARGSLHKDTFYGAIEHKGAIKHVVRKNLEDLKSSDIKNIVDPVVCSIVEENKDKIGREIIWFNKDKNIPIRKVRILTGVSNPVLLKEHSHKSEKEYKQHYRVGNDGNYALAVYAPGQGAICSKQVISLLDAVKKSKKGEELFPQVDKKGNPLRGILKIGTKVLLYKDKAEELKFLPPNELSKRLYHITGIEGI
ncbi:MAG: hypothetical protein KAS17_11755, partial [Victivallaceae bacterium]|nr:hypothetical protein [Victivallaceae bacterium]